MCKQNVLQYIRENRIDTDAERIFPGRKTDLPNSIGCCPDGDRWLLYETGKDGKLFPVYSCPDEDEIYCRLYLKIIGRVEGWL